ncbi:MAG: hypothetical protein ACRCUZ_02580, partial [Shewanella sp.]
SNNDAGYAGYTNDIDFKQDSLLGLQFDFQVNDKAKVTTQLVANGRYDFEPAMEVAYLSYDLDVATVRGGKLRTPFYMYSDYLDVGYAYPMLRPSQEIYELLIISSFTGVDALIPVKLGNTTLQLQPFTGVSQVEERDSSFDQKLDIKDVVGLAATWFIDDWTLRGSYAQASTGTSAISFISDQDATFASLGLQYNNGALIFNTEAMITKLDGAYPDVTTASMLLGYQINSVTPYVSMGHVESTDNDERPSSLSSFTMTRTSYSLGMRWDFAPKVALKTEVTYADYHETVGGLTSNKDAKGQPIYDDSIVYSASLDFVF